MLHFVSFVGIFFLSTLFQKNSEHCGEHLIETGLPERKAFYPEGEYLAL